MTETHGEIKNDPSSHPEAPTTATQRTTAIQNDEWLISIIEDDDEIKTNPPAGPKIPEVPVKLKEKCDEVGLPLRVSKCDEVWLPLAVSIGPYHYKDRKDKLDRMESLKYPMVRQFVKDWRKGNEARKVAILYGEVEKLTQEARKFYDEDKTKSFSDDAFTRMMFIDGCFVLQFIHCVTGGYEDLKESDPPQAFYEKLKTLSDQEVANVKRDLFLLENQLPFPVLTALMNERYKKGKGMERIEKFLPFRDQRRQFSTLSLILLLFLCGLCYVCCCCCCWAPPPIKENDVLQQAASEDGQQSDQKCTHLLQLLYSKFTVSQKGAGAGKPKLSLRSRGHYLYYPAKDLKKVGIHFRPNGTGALTDVKLSSSIFCGKLKLPPITIDKSTESMLLNLLAYESALHVDCNVISSYIHFMDSLIDDAEDVKELRSRGILFNYLGTDQAVAKLFNDMSKSLDPETLSYYNDVKRDINMQCDSTFKRWVADSQHKYFSSPWSFIALIAAAFTIFLTAVATYVAVWPID